MIMTNQTSQAVKEFIQKAGWEIGDSFPGPEGFFPKKTVTPHLHFNMQGGGSCYLHWKNKLNVSTEINGFFIPDCPQDLKNKALDLIGKLKSAT